MVTGNTITVNLSGGGPWGFRLIGGEGFPLEIAKVRRKSKAYAAGIQEGDKLVSINGVSMAGKSHEEAMTEVDNSGGVLTITVARDGPMNPPPVAPKPARQTEPSMTNGMDNQDGGYNNNNYIVPATPQQQPVQYSPAPPEVRPSPTPSYNNMYQSYQSPDGRVKTDVMTRSFESERDGRVNRGFVRQFVTQHKGQMVPGGTVFAEVSRVTDYENDNSQYLTPNRKPSRSPSPYQVSPQFQSNNQQYQPSFMARHLQEQQEQQQQTPPSPQPQSFDTPQMFRVKNLRNEMKENLSPAPITQPRYSPIAQVPDYSGYTSDAPVFRVRNNRNVRGQGQTTPTAKSPSPFPDSLTTSYESQPNFQTREQFQPTLSQPMQQPPMQSQPDSGNPPPPAPPLPANLRVDGQSNRASSVPAADPGMFPVPRGPFVHFDARQLLENQSRTNGDNNGDYEDKIAEFEATHHGKLPIFAPKVEISAEEIREMEERLPEHIRQKMYPHDLEPLDLTRIHSVESENTDLGSPDTLGKRKKKMYSDSSFYNDPKADYPTIEEQIDLCKKISRSLTSAANRKARGAKMFARRKKRANRWVHDGSSHHDSSSAGDIADIRDLDSELSIEDGGTGNLFTFRIPNLKFRIAQHEVPKMSISKDEFERLRLQKSKCNHNVVSPETCHSLVADLQSKRNKGARLFQKRQARSEKWVIDESNAVKPKMKMEEINRFLQATSPGAQNNVSPWNAALQSETRNYGAPIRATVPPPQASHHDLRTEASMDVLTGPNYNRSPRGWGGFSTSHGQTRRSSGHHHHHHQQQQQQVAYQPEMPPPTMPKPLKGDNFNRKVQPWSTDMSGQSVHPAVMAERARAAPQQNFSRPKSFHADPAFYHDMDYVAASDL